MGSFIMHKNRFGGDRRCVNMINVIAIPYKNFKDKIRIMKENNGLRFSDIDGVLISYSYAVDEESAFSLCRKERC